MEATQMTQTQSKKDAEMIDAAISAAQSQDVTVIIRYDGSVTYLAGEVGNPKALGKKMTTVAANTAPRTAYMQICRDLDLVA